MRSRTIPMREVHVWELPVRVYHWVNALCVTVALHYRLSYRQTRLHL